MAFMAGPNFLSIDDDGAFLHNTRQVFLQRESGIMDMT